jgi:hypothetical protein
MAAAFLAMNEVFGKRFFNVSPVDMFESAAYADTGPPQDLFVFDDQTHIVRTSMNTPNALRALAQGPGAASSAAGFTANPFNGRAGNPAGVDELGSPWTPWNPAELFPDSGSGRESSRQPPHRLLVGECEAALDGRTRGVVALR